MVAAKLFSGWALLVATRFCLCEGMQLGRVPIPGVSDFGAEPSGWDSEYGELEATSRALAQKLRPEPPQCGFSSDCPTTYKIAHVIQASLQEPSADEVELLEQQRLGAKDLCEAFDHDKIQANGGWCYDKNGASQEKRRTDIWYLVPEHHVPPGEEFVQAIVDRVMTRADGTCCDSVNDFGAGVGQYGHAMRALHPTLDYHGFDGAGNVQEFTQGFVKYFDLTRNAGIPRADWVMTFEVGEHIPNKFEASMLSNIHASNCRGVLLSWGNLNQKGHGHVNCHSPEFLNDTFSSLGYTLNNDKTAALREAALKSHANGAMNWWFVDHTLVFDRNEIPPECGASVGAGVTELEN